MPVVNIGTAQKMFKILKESLTKKNGLDFSNIIAFGKSVQNGSLESLLVSKYHLYSAMFQ